MSILRAGLYERVSTDEQALKGYSIDAQKDLLAEYCQKNEVKIVGHYTDEGISGAKPPLKRPALQRLLDDVQAGRIDIILFTKLDRWFRSVQEYYKVQEVLDKNNVTWKAILEDYNTDTSDGRLKVNIMLSVAANERERTSERIKVVFEHKRKNRELCLSDAAIPMGYIREKDKDGLNRLVKDPETEDMMTEFWELFAKREQLSTVARYINAKYNINRTYTSWRSLVLCEFYSGEYRGIKEFCEPYVDREVWERLQSKKIKKTQNNRVYLFTGLMKCPECGRVLSSKYYKNINNVEYRSYRCVQYTVGACSNKHTVSENKTEKYLLDNWTDLITKEISKVELEHAAPKPKRKTNIATLKEKLRKLNVGYMAGNFSDDEYLTESATIKKLLEEAEKEEAPQERDLTPLKKLLEIDYRSIYEGLTPEERRRFWRGHIKELIIEKNDVKEVIFL